MRHRRRKRRSIILIGFMGSGKTTIGLRLSYRLRLGVEDTDKLIEQREGRSISDIFATEGEEYFRRAETSLLKELSRNSVPLILSVGGGTPLRKENRELLKKIGTVVYLRVTSRTVYERLKGDTTRPLLQGDDPYSRIRELLDSREEAYLDAAGIIIDTDGLEPEEVLDRIVSGLKDRKYP